MTKQCLSGRASRRPGQRARVWLIGGALLLGACSSSAELSRDSIAEGQTSATTVENTATEATATAATTVTTTAASTVTTTAASTVTTTAASTVTTAPATTTAAGAPAATTATAATAARPYEVVVPSSYQASIPAPLIVALHGYTSSGENIRPWFGLDAVAEANGILTVYPNGTKDSNGAPFWNATDACCNFAGAAVDDSTYLAELVEIVQREYNVDAKRIYFLGHSNGGFMSYRMACEHSNLIAAVVSLAGETFADQSACTPTEPVSIAQVHGTSDLVINYQGGDLFGKRYPSASSTVEIWAGYNRCTKPLPLPTTKVLDLDSGVAGAETSIAGASGCPGGIAAELWSIDLGAHSPELTPAFAAKVIDFFLAHPKP